MLTFSILVCEDKEKKGRMVEWVEKASFDRLNKFVITSNEMNNQTLLSAQNLLAVIREPQPYVLPIISRRLPKVVVPEEHHVFKELPFYEEARKADAKACQERLDQREKKKQEGKLRKAPGEKGQASSSIAHPPTKKKKPSAKAVKVLAHVLASSSASTPSTLTSPESSVPDLGGDLDPLRSDLNPQSSESKPVIPDILYESEAKEEMAADMRADFRDRQRKRLFKPIEVVAPPAKRSCSKEVHEEPIINAPPTPIPHPDAASPIRIKTCRAQEGALDGPAPVEEDLD